MNISKDLTIGELVSKYPESVSVLFGFGMGCVGCPSAQAETIEEACGVHGLELEELLDVLNETIGFPE